MAWESASGRWNAVERDRVARRFRHHVRTKHNPRGRIRREPCCLCGGLARKTHAHHVDYTETFKVVWLCFTHHREVERGLHKIKGSMIWDYTSLVSIRPNLWVHTPF